MENTKLRKWILLIEDDTDLKETLSESLEANHYFPVLASTAREALQKLRNQVFFCVVTDLRLKEGTGEDVIEAIRDPARPDKNAETPVVVISGHLDRDVAARLKGKIQGALIKPFRLQDLLSKLETFDGKPADKSSPKLS